MRARRAGMGIAGLLATLAVSVPGAAQSPDASGSPAPAASGSAAGQAFPRAGALEPGTYTTEVAGVPVTVTVDGSWPDAGEIDGVGAFFARPDGTLVSITTFPGQVFTEPCGPEPVEDRETTARSFIDFLASHPALTVLAEPSEVDLGDVSGWQVDVSAALPAECTEGPRIWLWELPIVGDFHMDDGGKARFVALDAGDRVVTIIAEAYGQADWDTFLEEVEAIIGSVTVDPSVPAASASPTAS